MMQFAHTPLSKTLGLQFYKLLGSGKTGFNPFPDWSTYALLQLWDDEAAAHTFFETSKIMGRYRKKSKEQWTVYMKNITAKGEWTGKNPFVPSNDLDENNPHISVITRATIKKRMLLKFWKFVPISQQPLNGNLGLIYTKGIGEAPFFQMVTFSLWKDKKSLMDFAYKSKEHQQAIQKTRQLNWYKEELFSRFQPYSSIGTWNGTNPLPNLLSQKKK
jgi:heme-degrading monooxygenase HmoA